VSAADARRIAGELAAAKGWPFVEPIQVRRHRASPLLGPWRWTVVTNAASRGANVRVEIDARTGTLVSSGFSPR
jgi:hypothetical protein